MAAKISFIKQKSSSKLHNDNPVQVSFYEKTAFCQILVYHNKLKKEELLQKMRLASADFVKKAREAKIVNWLLSFSTQFTQEEIIAFWEGLVISSYSFEKYKTKKNSRLVFEFDKTAGNPTFINKLTSLKEELDTLRNWVNEPFSYLNAETFTKEIKEHCSKYGVSVDVWDKQKITKQKMAGLLAVNQGSKDEPSFLELTYKPLNADNKKPVVLIGKGVVFDAGGMNIKTENYMTDMKDDMAGAATAACTIALAARLKMPLYIKVLIPITDNRLNGNALVPGDIITMRNGTTVEITNTDAEGRLLLADAVCYAAAELSPSLMITVATLTGAAARALGPQGIAVMQENASPQAVTALTAAGEKTHERVCFFPMWKEYEEELKSDIADIKNCGNGAAGMISAAKFLTYFAEEKPLVHLDIAGVAMLKKPLYPYGIGASGIGLRLLAEFLGTLLK